MNVKEWLSTITAAAGVAVLIGTVAYQAGWVVRRADAQTMIDNAASLVATQAAQAVLDEATARETADLLFRKEPLVARIRQLMDTQNRSGGEEFELQEAVKELDRINARLDQLARAETAAQ